MNCSIHQDVVAVSSCGKCGVAMCNDCLETSEYNINDVALCRNCNYNVINEELSDDRSAKTWLIVKLIFGAIFIVLGIIAYMYQGNWQDGVIFWALSGFPTGWKMMKGNAETRARDRLDDAVEDLRSPGGGLMNMFLRFIFKVLFALAIGAIAAPILLIVNIVKLNKIKHSITDNETMLLAFE